MGRAIHELRARGTRLLKPVEFIGKEAVTLRTCGVPPGVRCKSAMKQVKASQIFDVEITGKKISQFDRRKEMKAECQASTVAEVDFAVVHDVILLQPPDILDGIDKRRRGAPHRSNRRYQMPRRNACDFRRDILQTCNVKMAESAVQAKSQIDRGIGFRQPVHQICDVEFQVHTRKVGKISRRQLRPLYLRLCDVESTRGYAAESKRMRTYHQSASPRTGSAARIEEPDRACTGSSQVSQS